MVLLTDYYGTKLKIRDFDAAIGYIFSVCPLPRGATPEAVYLPLLAIYCKFLSLMVFDKMGMHKPPSMACIVVGAPPGCGGTKAIMFGATIRGNNKKAMQKYRLEQLKNAYHVGDFPKTSEFQSYGHCAETYPFICNIRTYVLVELCLPHST